MRSRIILIAVFIAALAATLLFRTPHSVKEGGVWRLERQIQILQRVNDSLNAISGGYP